MKQLINHESIIFTGGSGLLGTAFRKIAPDINYPSSADFNVIDYGQIKKYTKSIDCKLIIHAAAFTSPPKIDENPVKAIDVNIIGTSNVVKLCQASFKIGVKICTNYGQTQIL